MSRQSDRDEPERQKQAVQLFMKVRPNFESDQAAIEAVAGILGIDSPRTLRKWIQREQIDSYPVNSVSSRIRSFKRWLFRPHAIVIGTVVTVLGGLGLFYSQQILGTGGQTTQTTQTIPHLEVDQSPTYKL